MKKKDIITLIVCLFLIIACSAIIYIQLTPKKDKNKNAPDTPASRIKSIPDSFDEDTYNKIESLEQYKKPELNNLGKSDLFSK